MSDHGREAPRAHLVESIPTGLEDLARMPGVESTVATLVRLIRAAQSTIDLTAMYWALLPDPSGDDKGFTDAQLEQMGAGAGRELYQALKDAAARGVGIRILESPGLSATPSQPPPKPESDALRQEYPDQVSIHAISMGQWYGGDGIMHQKIWIFDARHVYIGSANMDWKSLSQVKELGVALEDCPEIAAEVGRYFEGWWTVSAQPPSCVEVFDPAVRIDRKVPPWSTLVPADRRAPSPLTGKHYATPYDRWNPLPQALDGERGGVFLTGSPPEMCGDGRTRDEDGLVYTIDDARRSVCLSVMDFAPVGLYRQPDAGPPLGPVGVVPDDATVWWPSLFDALLRAVLTRRIYVRLLVSRWAHSSGMIEPFLRALQAAADAGRADKYLTAGQLEVKLFVVPGWDSTTGSFRSYPGHTRVNHTKYIVTDRRVNIGTSNMTWDYFAATAGTSFNADHAALVRRLQAVFDRDWASRYAWRLT